MRRQIESPPVSMNELYLELACSDMKDPRFNARNFGAQPVGHIYAAVQYVRKREKRVANNLSTTTASLAEIVASFASQGKSKLEARKLLPFPKEAQEDSTTPRIGAAAAGSIQRCIRDRTLPLDVLVLLREDLERAEPYA
jgi:hypothetical protein